MTPNNSKDKNLMDDKKDNSQMPDDVGALSAKQKEVADKVGNKDSDSVRKKKKKRKPGIRL